VGSRPDDQDGRAGPACLAEAQLGDRVLVRGIAAHDHDQIRVVDVSQLAGR
jgi:hypothetical protein